VTATFNLVQTRIDQFTARTAGYAAGTVSPSAVLCIDEAVKCLDKAIAGDAHPNADRTAQMLPSTWVGSAVAWTNKAAQHQWGFQTPIWWARP
jgi:hypothetical protein